MADAKQDIGKAVIHILKQQYPDQEITVTPSEVGRILTYIAEKELQKNPEDARDSIMDFLTYISTGSKYEMGEDGKVVYEEDEDGNQRRKPRTTPQPWNFAKDFDKWQDALKAIYTNLKRRSIDKSKSKTQRKKKEESVDDAFGTRGEGGGASEGGEARTPTPDATALGKALDDKAAVKEFIEVIDKHIGDLRESLPIEQQVLFDLVFEDEVGSFGSDIKENMGQATSLKEKLTGPNATPEMQALYKKNEKRWSGFVGDTRKKLLNSIRDFVDQQLPQADVDVLWSEFFSDTTPENMARKEKEEIQGKGQYQTDIDSRKLGRLKWKKENGEEFTPKDKKEYDRLVAKLEKAGVKESSVEALHPDAKGKNLKKSASVLHIAARLTDLHVSPAWL